MHKKNGEYINDACDGDNTIKCCQNFDIPEHIKGIDISYYQKETVDFNKINNNNNIEFVIMRAMGDAVYNDKFIETHQNSVKYPCSLTYNNKGPCFEYYYSEASKTNLMKGAYIFSTANSRTKMKNEIDKLLEYIEGKSFELPIYIDIEKRSQLDMNAGALTDMIIYGCNLIKEKNFKAGVYTGCIYVESGKIDADLIKSKGYEVWCSRYWTKKSEYDPNKHYNPDKHDFSDLATIFQYACTGIIEGIEGYVDLNARYIFENKSLCNCKGDKMNNIHISNYTNKNNISNDVNTVDSGNCNCNNYESEEDKDKSDKNKKSPWIWIGIGIGIFVLIIMIIICVCCCKR